MLRRPAIRGISGPLPPPLARKKAIRELLERLNHRPFRKRLLTDPNASRASLFESLDKPALRPLPTEPFDMSAVVARPREHRLPCRL